MQGEGAAMENASNSVSGQDRDRREAKQRKTERRKSYDVRDAYGWGSILKHIC